MKAINPTLISDNNTFKFKSFKSAHVDQIDVFHKGNRVAILNGIDGAALRWGTNSEKIKYFFPEINIHFNSNFL